MQMAIVPRMSKRWSDEARARFTSPEYRAWQAMRQRCNNSNHPKYSRYGGRGITICAAWDDFDVFLCDVGARPSDKHSLGRIDNDGDYEPANVHWETASQQANNRSAHRILTIDGVSRTVAQWACGYEISLFTIFQRLDRGWSSKRAVYEPVRAGEYRTERVLTHGGKTMPLCEWARECGLSSATISKRLKRGWSVADALTRPLDNRGGVHVG